MSTWAMGKVGKATFEGADVCVNAWDCTEAGTRVPTSNACNPGIETSSQGNVKWTGSFSGVWDLDNHFTNTFQAGVTGTLKLYVSATQFISQAIEITDINITSDIGGSVDYTASFEGTALPVYPA